MRLRHFGASAPFHFPVFQQFVWDFFQKPRWPLENITESRIQSHMRIAQVKFVARAGDRDKLYLSYPHMRLNAGFGDVFQRPSRFLKEIPDELLEDWEVKRS